MVRYLLALIKVNSSQVEANTIKLTTVKRHVVFYFRLKQIEKTIIGAGTWFGTWIEKLCEDEIDTQHKFTDIAKMVFK